MALTHIHTDDLRFGTRNYEWKNIVKECEVAGPYRAIVTMSQSVTAKSFFGRLLTLMIQHYLDHDSLCRFEKSDYLRIILNLVGLLHKSNVPIRFKGKSSITNLETFAVATVMYDELVGAKKYTSVPLSLPSPTVRYYMHEWNCSADDVIRRLAVDILKNLDL